MKNLRQKIRKSAGTALIGLAGLVGGCNEELMSSLSQELFMTGAQQAIASGIRNEIEGPRSPTIYVNSPQGNTEQNETLWDKSQGIQQPKKQTLWDIAQEQNKPTVPNLWDEYNKKNKPTVPNLWDEYNKKK